MGYDRFASRHVHTVSPRALGTVVAAAGGLVVGVLVCLGVMRPAPRHDSAQRSSTDSSPRIEDRAGESRPEAPAFEVRPKTTVQTLPVAVASQRPRRGPEVDREAAEASETAYRERTLREHAQEPRDLKWAREAEKSLGAELATIGSKSHFEVVDVDCRTTTCQATLQWGSYSAARRQGSLLAEHVYSMRCARDVFLPAPGDPTAPYQGNMILNCEEARAEGP